MDFVSHGLWGGLVFGRKKISWFVLAFFFGVMPDLFSFGLLWIGERLGLVVGPDWSQGLPPMSAIPHFVHVMYNITHSLVVFFVILTLVLLFTRKTFWPIVAWGLHIVMDIPSHSLKFFPTPFLWPYSDYRFDGIGWGHPFIFYPNIVILVLLYSIFLYARLKKKNRGKESYE